jgi:transcriptional regulator with XRE-family HTH domain
MPRRTVPVDPSIGERIRTRRRLRNWSVRHAASRAGISHTTWSRIERGLMACDNRFLVADIAAALDVPVAELVGQPTTPNDRDLVTARGRVLDVRGMLMDTALDEPTTHEPRQLQ